MNKIVRTEIESILKENILHTTAVGGGCISNNQQVYTESGKKFFLKSGFSNRMFRCEANGLKELDKAGAIRIPRIISVSEDYLLMEWISPGKYPDCFFEIFGKTLARLHRFQSDRFGFYEDNFIGSNPQPNIAEKEEETDWTSFYYNKRLLFQYKLAEKNGYNSALLKTGFIKLEKKIESLLSGSEESPCLLHGDLWKGNYLHDENGFPVLIDPAVYYGHREADLAMTKLFGGFPSSFYDSYNQEYPLKEGWQKREDLYKLYHILNHLNLFGKTYLSEAEYLTTAIIRKN